MNRKTKKAYTFIFITAIVSILCIAMAAASLEITNEFVAPQLTDFYVGGQSLDYFFDPTEFPVTVTINVTDENGTIYIHKVKTVTGYDKIPISFGFQNSGVHLESYNLVVSYEFANETIVHDLWDFTFVKSNLYAGNITAPYFTEPPYWYNVNKSGTKVYDPFTVVDLANITDDYDDSDILYYSIPSQTNSDILCDFLGDNSTVYCELVERVETANSTITVRVTDNNLYRDAQIEIYLTENNISGAPYFLNNTNVFDVDEDNVTTGTQIIVISNLTQVTGDPDNDVLTYNITSQTNTDITCSIVGETLSCQPTVIGNETSIITVELDDGFGKQTEGNISITFTESLAPINLAPFFNLSLDTYDVDATNTQVGVSFLVVDLSTITDDPENDTLSYVVSSETDSTNISCVIVTETLNCELLTRVFDATNIVTVTLSDAIHNVSEDVNITLTQNNISQAPYFKNITNAYDVNEINWNTSQAFTVIASLDAETDDPDGDTLAYTISSETNDTSLDCTITGDELNCSLVSSFMEGISTITVELDDGFGKKTYGDITISLSDLNYAPYFVNLTQVVNKTNLLVGEEFTVENLFAKSMDDDGDDLTVSFESNTNSGNVTCNLDNDNKTVSCFLAERVFDATTFLNVSVADSAQTTYAVIEVNLHDNNISQAPFFLNATSVYDKNLTGVTQFVPFIIIANLDLETDDLDNDTLVYAVTGNTDGNISCTIVSSELTCTLVTNVSAATNTITVELDDGFGKKTYGDITISINESNHPPYFTEELWKLNATQVDLTANIVFTVINNYSAVVADDDGDIVVMSVFNQTDLNVDCGVDEKFLNCTYVGNAIDVLSTVTLELSDGRGGLTYGVFNVSIISGNLLPYFTVNLTDYNKSLSGLHYNESFELIVNSSDIIADKNNDTLNLTVYAQSNKNISCSFTDDDLNCTLVASAVDAFSTVTVQLDDNKGGIVYGDINISLTQNDVLVLSNFTVSPDLNNTIGDGIAMSIEFNSTKYPLNVTVSLHDLTDLVVATFGVTVLVNETALPVIFTTPSNLTDGNYTISLTGVTENETVDETVGVLQLKNTVVTPSTGGGSGGSRRGGGSGIYIPPINTTELLNSGGLESDGDLGTELIVPVNETEDVGSLLVEDNETGDDITGQLTGSEDEGSLAWLWWVIVLSTLSGIGWYIRSKHVQKG